jgi:hypothetical protein
MTEALKVVSPPKGEELKFWAGGKPVKEHPEIAGLFPKRTPQDLQDLKVSIAVNGQDGQCLFLEMSDHFLVIDGHDTCRAIASLQREGRQIEVVYDLYEPKATIEEKALLEVMAVAIRRKNLQTAQPVHENDKKAAILRYLLACSDQRIHRTAAWVAEDLGCSRTWVTKVREQAIKEDKLPRVESYETRNGGYQTSEFYRAPFSVVKDVEGHAGRTVLEVEEEEAKAEAEAEAEARLKARAEAEAAQAAAEAALERSDEAEAEADEAEAEADGFEDQAGAVKAQVEQEAVRFAEEKARLVRWNTQRPKPFTPAQLNFLWGADLVDTDSEEVRLLADRDKLEAQLCDLLAPILEDVGVAPEKLRRSLHNLLKTTK